jgi:phosphate/sulfate permease
MSEREYFSARYLVTGSTFLLLVFAYHIFPLSSVLKQPASLIEAIVAFLALLGTPTIGFLISQLWWQLFQRRFEIWSMSGVEQLTAYCRDLKTKTKEDRKNAFFVYDYVLHSKLHSSSKMKGLSKYAFRRYDNYILLSCAKFSLILGVGLGLLSRFIAPLLFNRVPFFMGWQEIVWWVIVSIVASVIAVALCKGAQWVQLEHKKVHDTVIKALISESEIEKGKLRQIFPDYFETSENKNRKP